MAEPDTLHIRVKDCVVQLFVGIYDHEKPQRQPVIVHIDATALLLRRYDDLASANLATIINYEHIFHFVTETLPTLGHVPLLESLAERIITFCFEDLRIIDVHVRLDKPEAFKGRAKVGIEMRRHRTP